MRETWSERLDEVGELRRSDAGGFLDKVASFPRLLAAGLAAPPPELVAPRRILCGGMGGSAMAGRLLAALLVEAGGGCLVSVRDYRWPATADGDLLLLCSYSGNTEEVLALQSEAAQLGLPQVMISSGGELATRAAGAHPFLELPPGMPPRAALPAMLGRLLALLRSLGDPWSRVWDGVDETLVARLEKIVDQCHPERPVTENPAKAMALAIGTARPAWVALAPVFVPVAERLRAQFEENAKRRAAVLSLPELHHNSWVPWLEGDAPERVVWLGETLASPRVLLRRQLSQAELAALGDEPINLPSEGPEILAHVLTSVLVGDFITAYHALMRGVDPTPTRALDSMKRRLAELKEPS